jgi:hypothetical protein
MSAELRVVRAADVDPRAPEEAPWLVEDLWGAGSVGVIGGAPKSCKTWLALEMAVAVASGRPCLGRYAVPAPGPAIVYAAEDSPPAVRERLENLALARGTDFSKLDVGLIVEPSLRLDRADDLSRLRATLERRKPRLLLLDPYVRLQSADENNATEVAAILSTLRELSRTFACAIALVHHARKGSGDEPGQALRGSSDFYAWADSLLHLRRTREGLALAVEHRSGVSRPPIGLTLVTEAGPVRLEAGAAPPQAPRARATHTDPASTPPGSSQADAERRGSRAHLGGSRRAHPGGSAHAETGSRFRFLEGRTTRLKDWGITDRLSRFR